MGICTTMTDNPATTPIETTLRDIYPTHPLIMDAADEIERLRRKIDFMWQYMEGNAPVYCEEDWLKQEALVQKSDDPQTTPDRPSFFERWSRVIFGTATCRKCGLMRVAARDVECKCEWSKRDA